jgi:signal transduction histidine kinase
MRQRIESLSGRLQVESEPGGGTAISACVPAAPAEARA